MLKMLEPRFEENFDPERPRTNRDPSRKGAAAEKKKLEHLVKKERKGAIKELRKDSRFLAKYGISHLFSNLKKYFLLKSIFYHTLRVFEEKL